jgi:uncharacterized membrane protein
MSDTMSEAKPPAGNGQVEDSLDCSKADCFQVQKSPALLFSVGLVVLFLLGSAARLYRLDEKSLWSDEVATIATSLGHSIDPEAFALRGQAFDPPFPVSAAFYREKAAAHTQKEDLQVHLQRTALVLRENVHPPLFFGLMTLWLYVVGVAKGLMPGMLRFPAALFGILCIPAMAWLALRLVALNASAYPSSACLGGGSTASPGEMGAARQSEQCKLFALSQAQGFALLASAFMALSAYQIDHAQDARPYTLLVLLALLAVGLAVERVRTHGVGWLGWLALALVLAAGLYTQYFFALFAGFVLAYLLAQGWRDKRVLLKSVLTAGVVGALFLPWLPSFRVQMTFFKSAGHYTAGLWKPLQLPEKLWRILCEFFLPHNPIGKILPLIILAISLTAWILHCRSARTPVGAIVPDDTSPRRGGLRQWLSPMVALLLLWLLVVLGGQIGLDLLKYTHTATIRRYLLLASPACYLLLSAALVQLMTGFKKASQPEYRWERWLSGALIALMLTLMAGDTANYLFRNHTSSDEFRQAAFRINGAYQPDDVVLVSKTGAMAVGMAYYLHPQVRMLGVDVPDFSALQPGTALMARLNRAVMGKARVWLVFSHAAPSTERGLADWLAREDFRQEDARKFPGVKVQQWVQTERR